MDLGSKNKSIKLTKLLNWKLIVGDLMLFFFFFASYLCLNFIFFLFFFFLLFFFKLEDNCFTMLCWFLPYNYTDQS